MRRNTSLNLSIKAVQFFFSHTRPVLHLLNTATLLSLLCPAQDKHSLSRCSRKLNKPLLCLFLLLVLRTPARACTPLQWDSAWDKEEEVMPEERDAAAMRLAACLRRGSGTMGAPDAAALWRAAKPQLQQYIKAAVALAVQEARMAANAQVRRCGLPRALKHALGQSVQREVATMVTDGSGLLSAAEEVAADKRAGTSRQHLEEQQQVEHSLFRMAKVWAAGLAQHVAQDELQRMALPAAQQAARCAVEKLVGRALVMAGAHVDASLVEPALQRLWEVGGAAALRGAQGAQEGEAWSGRAAQRCASDIRTLLKAALHGAELTQAIDQGAGPSTSAYPAAAPTVSPAGVALDQRTVSTMLDSALNEARRATFLLDAAHAVAAGAAAALRQAEAHATTVRAAFAAERAAAAQQLSAEPSAHEEEAARLAVEAAVTDAQHLPSTGAARVAAAYTAVDSATVGVRMHIAEWAARSVPSLPHVRASTQRAVCKAVDECLWPLLLATLAPVSLPQRQQGEGQQGEAQEGQAQQEELSSQLEQAVLTVLAGIDRPAPAHPVAPAEVQGIMRFMPGLQRAEPLRQAPPAGRVDVPGPPRGGHVAPPLTPAILPVVETVLVAMEAQQRAVEEGTQSARRRNGKRRRRADQRPLEVVVVQRALRHLRALREQLELQPQHVPQPCSAAQKALQEDWMEMWRRQPVRLQELWTQQGQGPVRALQEEQQAPDVFAHLPPAPPLHAPTEPLPTHICPLPHLGRRHILLFKRELAALHKVRMCVLACSVLGSKVHSTCCVCWCAPHIPKCAHSATYPNAGRRRARENKNPRYRNPVLPCQAARRAAHPHPTCLECRQGQGACYKCRACDTHPVEDTCPC